MNAIQAGRLVILKLILLALTVTPRVSAHGAADEFKGAWGLKYRAGLAPGQSTIRSRNSKDSTLTGWVHHWNEIAINATGLDHTPVAPDESRVFGEQFGPARSSRAMAIVHLAIFDAMNAVEGHYQSYTGLAPVREPMSMQAAVSQAARDTLVALFPSQTASFDNEMAADMARIPDRKAKTNGSDLGHRAALAILTIRANDGSQHVEPRVGIDYITSNAPGKWRQDPISQLPLALGALWSGVTPFVMNSAAQFRAPPPPALTSAAY